MKRLLAVAFTAVLLAAACGNGNQEPETTPSPTPPPQTPDAATLPGERLDLFPEEGASLAVVGVAADDTLNVRVGPGVEFEVVFELSPLATNITATGHNRTLGEAGIWSEVTSDGRTGWANSAFLLQPAQTTDVTADLYPAPADRPRAETMLELGQTVAADVASQEPPSRITVADGPTVGDLGEITVDVIGLGDDSVGGFRLQIFATPDASGEGFTVRTVESTLLCLRGVGDGICV